MFLVMNKLFVLLFLSSLLIGKVLAHEAKEHKPLVCIPDSERTEAQLQHDKQMKYIHRLSKLDQDCLILKVEELEKENKKLKDKLND